MNIDDIDDLELGKAAEHLVCADLILKGYHAFLADQGLPYDVVLEFKNRLLRIQVKATRKPKPIPQRKIHTPAYQFYARRAGKKGKRNYGNHEFDLICFVAMDIRVIAYLPFEQKLKRTIHLRIPGSHKINRGRNNIDEYPIEKALL